MNAIGIVQLVPGAIEKHEINIGNEKSFPFVPVKVSFERVRLSSPVLETVTESGALCVFTVWLANVSGFGESVMTGPVAVPLKFKISGPPLERV